MVGFDRWLVYGCSRSWSSVSPQRFPSPLVPPFLPRQSIVIDGEMEFPLIVSDQEVIISVPEIIIFMSEIIIFWGQNDHNRP